jgi:hypothetical protein
MTVAKTLLKSPCPQSGIFSLRPLMKLRRRSSPVGGLFGDPDLSNGGEAEQKLQRRKG